MLSSDTPTNDQNTVPFITPSPAGVEGHAPKAPLKKVCVILLSFPPFSPKHDLGILTVLCFGHSDPHHQSLSHK